jgi:hypothetical protein
MKLARLKKAIEKAGLKVSQSGNRYHVEGKGKYYGSFIEQNDEAICVSVCHVNEKPDIMTDYFPQFYMDTIKGFIHWMTKEGL